MPNIENGILNLPEGLRLRGGTSENLTAVNPILLCREIVVETDTGKIKVGDGIRSWNKLPYYRETVTEIRTLSDADIAAKGFTLQNSIASSEESNVMLSMNRLLMIYGIDFTASENYITWASMGLDEVGLFAGDIVVVRYIKA